MDPIQQFALALRDRVWLFEANDGTGIKAPELTLLPGGGIGGYASPDAVRWRIREGMLEWLNEAGDVTTRFSTVEEYDGKLHLLGQFLPETDQLVLHRLIEIRAWARPNGRSNTCLIVPIHEPYFQYGVNLLYQSIGADYDLCFVFSIESDRMAFARLIQPNPHLIYEAIVLDAYFTQEQGGHMLRKASFPTIKKLLALSLLYSDYAYCCCVDAETFILRNTGWPAAMQAICERAIWTGGTPHPDQRMVAERDIQRRSALDLTPLDEHPAILATGFQHAYTWWWEMPVYDSRLVPEFLRWIGWQYRADLVAKLTHYVFDHLTYQAFTLVHANYRLQRIDDLRHSLEFAPYSTVRAVHEAIAPMHWVNANAYVGNPYYFQQQGFLAVYHLDRTKFPQFEQEPLALPNA